MKRFSVKEGHYFKQAQLILRVIPHVAAENAFALKGGTAINLFVRDMPRLSVDIDLTWLPSEPRDIAVANIGEALQRIAMAIPKAMPEVTVQERYAKDAEDVSKLFVSTTEAVIKIEPNPVLRGTVFPPEHRELSQYVEDFFELSATISTLATADLYGGKLCAALDRQHPRDIYDVKVLMENEGITDEIRIAFVVYLASHARPMSELLSPNRKELRRIYENEFVGMTVDPIGYDELIAVREKFIKTINNTLTENERQFLLSIKQGKPKWGLMPVAGIDKLPAIQWKLFNIQKMKKEKHMASLQKLQSVLGL